MLNSDDLINKIKVYKITKLCGWCDDKSSNLYNQKIGWVVSDPLRKGMEKTYKWIKEQVDNNG